MPVWCTRHVGNFKQSEFLSRLHLCSGPQRGAAQQGTGRLHKLLQRQKLTRDQLLQLTEIEQAFKEVKSDSAIRPIYQKTEERIEAHIFVAFIACWLQITSSIGPRPLPGLTPSAVLEKHRLDADGRCAGAKHRRSFSDPATSCPAGHRSEVAALPTEAHSARLTATANPVTTGRGLLTESSFVAPTF